MKTASLPTSPVRAKNALERKIEDEPLSMHE
jgi:hypothetical protein